MKMSQYFIFANYTEEYGKGANFIILNFNGRKRNRRC